MIKTLLIANRGEIACRIIKTARKMGIRTVAVYSEADKQALHVQLADHAICIGAAEAHASYLNSDALLDAAAASSAEAIHPGYGFLSENPDFASAVQQAGLIFVGPPAEIIQKMGRKDAARQRMAAAGIPVVPGYDGADQSEAHLAAMAADIGYPLLIKARSGGGGKGMRLVEKKADFLESLKSAKREAASSFADDHVIIEKYITAPRHIEVQIISDTHGNHLHLYERDCSLQRRYQKVIEEAPAPNMPEAVREAMTKAARKAAQSIDYVGAGTVEFIADGENGLREDGFWFMEMNTRLQVEHPVTEMITGIDLVEWQLRVAAGEALPLSQEEITMQGHAVEARLYAEDARHAFRPCPGPVTALSFGQAPDIRIDTSIEHSGSVSRYYDPMIAKIISHNKDRATAFASLQDSLSRTYLLGTQTNLDFLSRLCADKAVLSANLDTHLIDRQLEALSAPQPVTALALLIACLGQSDLSQRFAGWRHWHSGHIPFIFRSEAGDIHPCQLAISDDNSYSLHYQGQQIHISDLRRNTSYPQRCDGHACWQFIYDGTACTAESLCAGQHISLSIASLSIDSRSGDNRTANRTNWQFEALDYIAAETLDGPQNTLTAPMTATVTAILVKNDEKVKAGQSLILLEAMKMEQSLKALQEGEIAKILVEPGQGVNEGDILLEYKDAPDKDAPEPKNS